MHYYGIYVVIATAKLHAKMASGGGEQMLSDSKDLVELLARLQETLTKATNKNDNLLEAIESSEAKATQTGSGEVNVCFDNILIEAHYHLFLPNRLPCYVTYELVWLLHMLQTLHFEEN